MTFRGGRETDNCPNANSQPEGPVILGGEVGSALPISLMTSNITDVTTEAEFSDQLDELLDSARHNDINIEGGWSCHPKNDSADYEVLISAVVRPSK